MDRLFAQYLAIYRIENVPNFFNIFAKVDLKFCPILNNSTENLPKALKVSQSGGFRQIWSH